MPRKRPAPVTGSVVSEGEPYSPPDRPAARFTVPSYDDVADFNVLFKRFADTSAAFSELPSTSLLDRSGSFAVSVADVQAGSNFLCTSSSVITVTLPDPTSLADSLGGVLAEGMRVSFVQGGAGKVTVSGPGVVGSVSTSAQYGALSATIHNGKWWCLPFGGGSQPGPGPSLLAPSLDSAVGGNGFVSLDWTPNPASSAASGFKVQYAHPQDPWTTLDVGLVSSTQVTGLVNGDTYKFQVFAYDGSGAGPVSNQLTAVPETDSPGELLPPTLLKAQSGDGKVTVSLQAPTGSGPFDSYIVEFSAAGSGAWSQLAVGLSTTADVNGLVNGKAYSFRARTSLTAPASVSLPSNVLNATPGSGAVPNPPALTSVSPGNAQLSVAWTAPLSGPAPLSYLVEWAQASAKYGEPLGDGVELSWSSKDVGLVLSSTIYALTNDVTYLVRVRSVRGAEVSEPSASDSGTPTGGGSGLLVSGYDDTFETDTHKLFIFKSPGTRKATVTGSGPAQVLVIGGGGGRAEYQDSPGVAFLYRPGAGGSGEVILDGGKVPTVQLSSGEYTVTVGATGSKGTISSSGGVGGSSSFVGSGASITARGGGGGGSYASAGSYGYSGGGGGARAYGQMGGSWSQGQAGQPGTGSDGRDGVAGVLTSDGFPYGAPGGGYSGVGTFDSVVKAYQAKLPGWVPSSSDTEIWVRWAEVCVPNAPGKSPNPLGFCVGGMSPNLWINDQYNNIASAAYGWGAGEVVDNKFPPGGVVAICVQKADPVPLPDIAGGAKYLVDDWVFHVFDDGGSYTLRVNGKYPVEGTFVDAEVLLLGGGGATGARTTIADQAMYQSGFGGGGQLLLEDGLLPRAQLQLGSYQVKVAGQAFGSGGGDVQQSAGFPSVFSGPTVDLSAQGGGGGGPGVKGVSAASNGWTGGGGGYGVTYSPISEWYNNGSSGSGGGAGNAAALLGQNKSSGGGGGTVGNAGQAGIENYGGIGWRPKAGVDGSHWVSLFSALDIGHVGCGAGQGVNPALDVSKNNAFGAGAAFNKPSFGGLVVVGYPVRPK